MGRRPNGNVSVIEVKPEDLPGACCHCLFFDYRPEYAESMEALPPEYDSLYEEWMHWDGLCRRHPPTTGGKLPSVTGDTLGCGDGLAGRVADELKPRRSDA